MNTIYKKTLVIGIILLLVGVSVSSAISVDNKPVVSQDESEEDCGCKSVSDTEKVYLERQLDKVEVYTRLLMVLDRDNQEMQKICGELLELINSDGIWEDFCNTFLDFINYLLDLRWEPEIGFFMEIIISGICMILTQPYILLCFPFIPTN